MITPPAKKQSLDKKELKKDEKKILFVEDEHRGHK